MTEKTATIAATVVLLVLLTVIGELLFRHA